MIAKTDKLTPSLKRLLIEFMAKRQTDRYGSSVGEIAASIANGGLAKSAEGALDDLNVALKAVRNAVKPNQFSNATDEEIAAAILEQLKQRRATATAQVTEPHTSQDAAQSDSIEGEGR